MRRSERGFYTLLGWVTWKAAKWYVAKRLGLRSKAKKGAVVLALVAAGGGAFAYARSQSQQTPGS
ncbi:hypothetical protein [Patulibacter minatonensis]|uniref:hypothetical protein n=1 Tax=Patulibacter minatonensis TaxID=298163 RepID=UPI00047A5424|nr:hypothetical protein [Patulibacter minatonensis]